ncbi:hypothetical protein [Paludisphaera rhizosphaerae]|uniref:hypothetical protein n=1 Tax=Paludisphaera rhizosphaerae TaxID=2711216 RepID=UPI0013EA69CD|nr:hypothetical protein [Paludisphaera rhizosphaerae]
MTARTLYLVEMTAYDPAIAGERVLRFASAPGHVTRPSESPANEVYEPRLVDPGNWAQYLVDALATEGASGSGGGAVVLNNADGALDGLLEYGFDGRPIVVRMGTAGAPHPSGFPPILTGVMEQIEPTLTTIAVVLRDRRAEVADKPFQPLKFAGDNVLPNGVEGVADDLKDKPKPLLLGKCRNLPPPLVNTTKLAYQVSSAEIRSIDGVYVGGAAVAAGTAHASLAALQAASPAGGQYDYYLGASGDGAYLRLGTSPSAVVTCDATEGATAADRTAAQLARRVLVAAGVPSGDVDSASVAALDLANPAAVGFWGGEDELTTGPVLDAILRSVGGYWAVDPLGRFRLGRLEAPSGSPLLTIERHELVATGGEPVERLSARGEGRGLPAFRVTVGYRRNWTVMADSDVVGSVGQDRRNFLKQELRTTAAVDATVQAKHPMAGEKQAATLLDDEAAAAAEAARLLDLYKVRRDLLQVRLPASLLKGAGVALGSVVALDLDRFDWSGGKSFRVVGIGGELAAGAITLQLWG